MSVQLAAESSNALSSSSSYTGLTLTSGRYFLLQFVPTIDTCEPVSHSIEVSTPLREAQTTVGISSLVAWLFVVVYQLMVLLSWTDPDVPHLAGSEFQFYLHWLKYFSSYNLMPCSALPQLCVATQWLHLPSGLENWHCWHCFLFTLFGC